MRLAWVTLAVACLSACSGLPDFGDGCGNLVLDEGEDCDGDASGLCDASCNLACGTDPECPDGYACGADALCHAPSGRFTQLPTAIPFQTDIYAVTDVDEDGYGDVVSLSSTSLGVNFGDHDGSLARVASTLTPRPLGTPAFTQLDADEALDLLVPTANGIAGYSSQYQVMSPHPFTIDLDKPSSCTNPLGQAFQIFAMDDRFLGLLTRHPMTGKLGFAIIDGAAKNACPTQPVQQICDIDVPVADPTSNAVVYVDVYTDVAPTGKIIGITLPQHGTCVIDTTHVAGNPLYTITNITPAGVAINSRPVLARLRPGGCPSLIDGDNAPSAIFEYRPTGSPGTCGFASAALLPLMGPTIPGDATVIGHLPLSPPLAGYGADALVLSTGAYAIPASGLVEEVYRSDRKLDAVESADLDGDGDIDAVGIAYGASDIDVLTRTQGDTFLSLRIATGPMLGLELADFDGNGISDVSYVELESTGRERLLVAYGTRDRLLDGVPMGTFARIVGMCQLQTADASDPNKLVDDLIVLDLPPDRPDRRQPLLTLLHGSPQRTMVSFFDPRTATSLATDDVFVGVAAGSFFATPASDAPLQDTTDVIAVQTTGTGVSVWPFRGTQPGALEFTPTAPPVAAGLLNCSRVGATTTGTVQSPQGMCIDGARYLTWPTADHDVVIAVESSGTAVKRSFAMLDPTSYAADGVAITVHKDPNAFSAVPGTLVSRSLRAADTDGDQHPDLIASFGVGGLFDPTGTSGEVMICQVDPSGVPASCTSAASITELMGLACVDAAPANVAPRGRGGFDHPPTESSRNLIVLCHAGPNGILSQLFRVYHDATGYHGEKVFERPGPIERIEIGDVNGDGLDDILALEVTGSLPNLLVITQCTSRDAAGCEVAR